MRQTTMATIFTLVVLAIGGAIYLAEPFNADRRIVQDLSTKFMEDIQFKDFRSSALYHHELEQDRVDIGKAIERLFLVKPEMLNIQDFRIVRTEIDSTSRRARVLVNSRFRRLNIDEEPEEADLQLFWIRRHPQCPLGSDCEAGECRDETGHLVLDEQEDEEGEEVEVPFECDSDLEHAWFMNLDSTLESRDYR